jgi:hypothetical protein
MGVLNDGTAFLTGRGLARLCGVDSSRISEMSASWNNEKPAPLSAKVQELLRSKGIVQEYPYIEITQCSGFFHAYPDVVCITVLE